MVLWLMEEKCSCIVRTQNILNKLIITNINKNHYNVYIDFFSLNVNKHLLNKHYDTRINKYISTHTVMENNYTILSSSLK